MTMAINNANSAAVAGGEGKVAGTRQGEGGGGRAAGAGDREGPDSKV